MSFPSSPASFRTALDAYASSFEDAAGADLQRALRLLSSGEDPWSRRSRLHLTASALVVHRPSRRVLLRWHERLRMWAQVGGHADPGESDALEVVLREAREETGLGDLRPCVVPGKLSAGAVVDLVIVRVPPGGSVVEEPAHEHVDVRFVLETHHPEAARPESARTPVQWLSFASALEAADEENLRGFLRRVSELVS